MSQACPYCGVILDSVPSEQGECDDCGGLYHIRPHTQLFETPILSKYQADSSDFFDSLQRFGVTINDYLATGKYLEDKWKRKPTYSDVLWTISNSGLVERSMNPSDATQALQILSKAKLLAWAQAEYQLKLGNDPRGILAVATNYDIQYAKILNQSDDLSFYLHAKDCCDDCMEDDGRIYTAADIEDNEYLPNPACTNRLHPDDDYAWCVCSYIVSL